MKPNKHCPEPWSREKSSLAREYVWPSTTKSIAGASAEQSMVYSLLKGGIMDNCLAPTAAAIDLTSSEGTTMREVPESTTPLLDVLTEAPLTCTSSSTISQYPVTPG